VVECVEANPAITGIALNEVFFQKFGSRMGTKRLYGLKDSTLTRLAESAKVNPVPLALESEPVTQPVAAQPLTETPEPQGIQLNANDSIDF
jgi:hypothetical protein